MVATTIDGTRLPGPTSLLLSPWVWLLGALTLSVLVGGVDSDRD